MVDSNNKKISSGWESVIELAKRAGYGRFEIQLVKGEPTMVYNLIQSIKIDNDDDFNKALKTVNLN